MAVVVAEVGDGQVGGQVAGDHAEGHEHDEVALVPVADAASHQEAVVVPPQHAALAELAVVAARRDHHVAALAASPWQPALLRHVQHDGVAVVLMEVAVVGGGWGGEEGDVAPEAVWGDVGEDVGVDVRPVLGRDVLVAVNDITHREG